VASLKQFEEEKKALQSEVDKLKGNYRSLPTPLHNTTPPHYTTLHYTTLHYTTLHYTTLHFTTTPPHYHSLKMYIEFSTKEKERLKQAEAQVARTESRVKEVLSGLAATEKRLGEMESKLIEAQAALKAEKERPRPSGVSGGGGGSQRTVGEEDLRKLRTELEEKTRVLIAKQVASLKQEEADLRAKLQAEIEEKEKYRMQLNKVSAEYAFPSPNLYNIATPFLCFSFSFFVYSSSPSILLPPPQFNSPFFNSSPFH